MKPRSVSPKAQKRMAEVKIQPPRSEKPKPKVKVLPEWMDLEEAAFGKKGKR